MGTSTAEGSHAARFADAYRALRANPDVQFDLHPAAPPTPDPAWWRAFREWLHDAMAPVRRMLDWLAGLIPDAPYARILLWSALIAAAVGLGWLLWTRLREGEWRLPRWRRPIAEDDADHDEGWQPEAAPARAWLDEADALAEQGLFAEAAHHLLIRSVEDIGRRRPGLIRPALTSRDLARAPAVPPRARELFAGIAAVVERSLFGGRAVGAEDWTSARAAYADFALPGQWRA